MIKPGVKNALVVTAKEGVKGEIPKAAARMVRSDEKPPTLTFSNSAMELASKIFNSGKFKAGSHFDDLTKEHMFLPKGQNDPLTANLTTESV